jgi:D-alanyl-D-alanine carboxypeptidase/D-alanyl-D-alanine-endopeptidase (penicillin-binding protein 4)
MASSFRDTRRRAPVRWWHRSGASRLRHVDIMLLARFAVCLGVAGVGVVPVRAEPDAEPGDVATETGLVQRIRTAIVRAKLGDQLGVSLVDVRSGRSLFAHNPMLPLDPASNQKLVTAAAALIELGPDFRMLTGLYGQVEQDAVVSGLYLKGYGDPTLQSADLVGLAEQIVARGVQSVDEVVVDGGYFDDRTLPPGFEAQPEEISPFRSAVAAVSVNANAYTLRVAPGSAVDAPARVRVDAEGYFALSNGITTSERGVANVIAVQNQKNDKLALRVSGTVPLGTPALAYRRRVEAPLYFAGYTLVEALRALRVQVPRRVRLASLPSGLPLLASRRSPPLAEQLSALGKQSDNFVAEMLLKVLGAERAGLPGSTDHGSRIALQALKRLNVSPGGVRILNGSGLFAPNRIAAGQLTQLLAAMYNNPSTRPEYVAHLAIAGLDGTLSKRLTQLPSPRVVRAKTGTLDDVIALSGYVLGRTPERVFAFSVLANGVSGKQQAARDLADAVALNAAQHLWTVPKAALRPALPATP